MEPLFSYKLLKLADCNFLQQHAECHKVYIEPLLLHDVAKCCPFLQGRGQDITFWGLSPTAPVMMSAGVRAYIGVWGGVPSGGPGAEPLVGDQGGKVP